MESIRAFKAAAMINFSKAPQPLLRQVTNTNEKLVCLSEAAAKAWLRQADVRHLRLPNSQTVQSVADCAVSHSKSGLRYPLVAKISADSIQHKSELGGVIVNITNQSELNGAVERLLTITPTVLIEEMITDPTAELLLNIKVDSQFGVVLTLGLGGVFAELFKDVARMILPISQQAFLERLADLQSYPIFAGYRGKSGVDLLKLYELVCALQEKFYHGVQTEGLREIELNPLLVSPAGFYAVDALISKQSTGC